MFTAVTSIALLINGIASGNGAMIIASGLFAIASNIGYIHYEIRKIVRK